MELEINNKTYKFNDDIRFGVLELVEKKIEDTRVLKIFIREVLIPEPTDEEIFNFKQSDIVNILKTFTTFQEETNIEFKKKLSQ